MRRAPLANLALRRAIGIGVDGAESLGEGLRQHLAGVQAFFRRIRAELPDLVIENSRAGVMERKGYSYERLQTLNPEKERATNAQIMFLVLHTSGLTLIPLTIIAYRISAGSVAPASIFIPCVIGTLMTTLASVIVVSIWQKIKWDLVLLGWVLAARLAWARSASRSAVVLATLSRM